jgi:hypothetical protein
MNNYGPFFPSPSCHYCTDSCYLYMSLSPWLIFHSNRYNFCYCWSFDRGPASAPHCKLQNSPSRSLIIIASKPLVDCINIYLDRSLASHPHNFSYVSLSNLHKKHNEALHIAFLAICNPRHHKIRTPSVPKKVNLGLDVTYSKYNESGQMYVQIHFIKIYHIQY